MAIERDALGRTGLTVSRLALGCAPIGNLYRAITDEEADATIDAAYAAGIRFFDTAPLYGHGLSERRVGAALRRHDRDGVVVATKVGRLLFPGAVDGTMFEDIPAMHWEFDFSYDATMRSLEASLERMGLDRVDVLHVHDPDDALEVALDGAFRALRQLRDEKVVGAIGAGMNNNEPLMRVVREADVDCVLVAGRCTLLDSTAADELLPLCAERGVAVIAAAVFNSGVLADPRPGAHYRYAPASDEVLRRATAMADLCAEAGVSLRAAALQFALRHPAVTCVLPGAQTVAEVQQAVLDLSTPIPDGLWDELAVYTHSK